MGFLFRRRAKLYGPQIILEPLEDRIVLDASVDAAAQENQEDAAENSPTDGTGLENRSESRNTMDSAVEELTTVFDRDLRVVLISNALDDVDDLAAAASDDAHVIMFDAKKEGAEALTAAIGDLTASTGREIDTLAVLAHGEDGQLQLGPEAIQESNQFKFAETFADLGSYLSEGAQIHLYGCSIAASDSGRALVDDIAESTGATVFATTDDTWGESGDWDLEYSTNPSVEMRESIDTSRVGEGSALVFPGRPPLDSEAGSLRWDSELDSNDPQAADGRDSYAETWTFTLTGTQDVSIGMQTTQPNDWHGDPGFLDCYVLLYSGDTANPANLITYNDDWSGGYTDTDAPVCQFDSLIYEYTLGPGTYTVEATTWEGDYWYEFATGDYYLLTSPNVVFGSQPSTGGIGDIEVFEDADDTVINLFNYFSHPEEPLADLTYTIENNTDPDLFTGNLSAGTTIVDPANFTLDYAPDAYGSADLTIRATDGDGEFAEASFNVTIFPVSDNPTIEDQTFHVDEGSAVTFTVWGTDPDAHDVSEVAFAYSPLSPAEGTLSPVGGVQQDPGDPTRYYQEFIYTSVPGGIGPHTFDITFTSPGTDWAGYDADNPHDVGSNSLKTYSIAVGHLDGDGLLDVVTGNYGERNWVYWGDGTETELNWGTATWAQTYDVKLGDFDNNGLTDIVFANYSESDTIYFNYGDKNLSDPYAIPRSDWDATSSVCVVDYDGDGDRDIVTGNWNGTVWIHLNDGSGAFPSSDSIEVGTGGGDARMIFVEDMDRDGDMDIVVGKYSSSASDVVLINEGVATFTNVYLPNSSDYTLGLQVADVNGDAVPDIITGNNGGTPNGHGERNRVYINQFDPDNPGVLPSFVGADVSPDSDTTIDIQLSDVDRDGDFDLITANDHEGQYDKVYLNHGNGAFASAITLGWVDSHSRAVDTSDATGNGYDDVFYGNFQWSYSGYSSVGLQNFSFTNLGGVPTDVTATVTIIVNPEGQLNDPPIAIDGSVAVDEDNSITFAVWGNDEDLPDASEVSFQWADPLYGTLTTDNIVHDAGHGDYYQEFTYTPFEHYFGTDGFDFTFTTPAPGKFTDGPGQSVGSDDGDSAYTRFVEFGDVDNDGDTDLVSGIKDGINRVYLNDGTGGFSDGVLDFGSDDTRSVQLGDINGDGWLDVVEGNDSGDGDRYYLNLGGSGGVWQGFDTNGVIFGEWDYTYSVALGDVNDDGWLDVVTGNTSGDTTKLYINNRESGGIWQGFSGSTDVGSDSLRTYQVILADIDRDGTLDIVTGNTGANLLYYNDGSGGFTSGSGTQIGSDADDTRGIDVADVDRDFWLDVVVGNSDEVNRLYMNDGAGGFALAAGIAIGSDAEQTYAVKAADINHDGYTDVIAGNRGSSGLPNRIYMNDGSGNFTPGSGTPLGSDTDRTYNLEVGDVNGDGWLDIMAGNRGATEKLYLNETVPETSSPATIDIVVRPIEDLPTAESGEVWVYRNTPETFQIIGYDPDLPDVWDVAFGLAFGDYTDHGDLTPEGGIVDLGNGYFSQTLTYTPDTDYWGDDSFRFFFSSPTGQWFGFPDGDGEPIGSSGDVYTPSDMEFIDIDHDGRPDILVEANGYIDWSGSNYDNRDYWTVNQPNTFHWIAQDGTIGPAVVMDAPGEERASTGLAIGDLNNDGYDDVVVHNSSSYNSAQLDVYYLWDPDSNTFGPGIDIPDTSIDVDRDSRIEYGDVAIGDLNADGHLDIVVGMGPNWDAPDSEEQDRIFFNDGFGNFGADVERMDVRDFWNTTTAIEVADMDNDGYDDIVVGKYAERTIVYFGDGSGEYDWPGTYTRLNGDSGSSHRRPFTTDLELGDVDGDGWIDIVTSSDDGWDEDRRKENRFYRNEGGRNFDDSLDVGEGVRENSKGINLADVNDDGYLDAIVLNDGQPNRYFLFDVDAGTFTGTGVELGDLSAFGDASFTAAAGDVDGDGDMDIVVGLQDEQNRFFENLGHESGNTNISVSEPATVTLHVGILRNPTFTDNYTGWNTVEERMDGSAGPWDGTFAVVPDGTTVDMWTGPGSNALYDHDDGIEVDQYSWELPITINGGDSNIALHTNNSPLHTWLTQEFTIPDSDGTGGDLGRIELHWSMAYWNHYTDWDTGEGEFVPGFQHMAMYMYDVDNTSPDPLWITTTEDDKTIVDEMRDYSVVVPSDLIGRDVRLVLEISSLYGFFEVAVDDFHILPTRLAEASIPFQPPAPELGSVHGPDETRHAFKAGGIPIVTRTILLDDSVALQTPAPAHGATTTAADMTLLGVLTDTSSGNEQLGESGTVGETPMLHEAGTSEGTTTLSETESNTPQSTPTQPVQSAADSGTQTSQSPSSEPATDNSISDTVSPDPVRLPESQSDNHILDQLDMTTSLIVDPSRVSAHDVLSASTPAPVHASEPDMGSLTAQACLAVSLDSVRLTELFTS